jgi:hypothetical protein
MSKTRRWKLIVIVLLAACLVALALVPAVTNTALRIALAPFNVAFQLTTVLFSALPVLGLAWFAWHLIFKRRVRLMKLRRIRLKQGRCDNLLAPAPIFGAAYKKGTERTNSSNENR